MGKLSFVITDVYLALKRLSRGIFYDHDDTQHTNCVILLCFFVFTLLCCKYICDIYLSIMDSNGLSKLNNIFIYKITEEIQ